MTDELLTIDDIAELSKKVNVQTLARISRHNDISLLISVYYRETAEEIAARLP